MSHGNGVAPNFLYRWRRLMLEGGGVAITGDDDVTSNREVREIKSSIRELERSSTGRRWRSRSSRKRSIVRAQKSDLAHAIAAARRTYRATSLAGWIEVYIEHYPHAGLKVRSPRELD